MQVKSSLFVKIKPTSLKLFKNSEIRYCVTHLWWFSSIINLKSLLLKLLRNMSIVIFSKTQQMTCLLSALKNWSMFIIFLNIENSHVQYLKNL